MNVEALRRYTNVNGGENPRKIYVGQTIHDEGTDTCLFHRIDFPK